MKSCIKYTCIILLLALPCFFSATTIPFELIDGKIMIKVSINRNPHNFIFDSGAFTLISSELKSEMNAKKSNIIFEAVDANNVKSKSDVFTLNSLKISDLNFKNVDFSFMDISWMSSRACKKISGILGANVMKDKIWRIDFNSKTISIFNETQENDLPASIKIPFSQENFTGIPKVNTEIRNQNIEFVFDTGSNMGFSVNQKIYDLIKDDRSLVFEGLLSQGINSISKGQRQVDLMEVIFNNSSAGSQIVDTNNEGSSLIGTKFMENYVTDLDFINKKIVLSPNGKKAEYRNWGISLAPIDQNIMIVNKLQVPQLADLELGEKIIKINDIDIAKVNDGTFCEIKKIMDSNEKITLETESRKKITLEKKDVLQYLN